MSSKIISSGQKVIVWLGSANRYETVLDEPDRFDIKGDTSAHLAFGSGIHFCKSASLVRLKNRVVLKVLLQQLQNVTLIDEYDKKPLDPVDVLVFD
jgi:cytochrome P450